MHGAKIKFTYHRGYPVTVNHADQTAFAARIAADVAGDARVNTAVAPIMGAEDFSYMLEARPGCFIFIGNGDSAGLHHERYDFDDNAISTGVSYWVRLVEQALPA
jgi:hippurate hydrolase